MFMIVDFGISNIAIEVEIIGIDFRVLVMCFLLSYLLLLVSFL